MRLKLPILVLFSALVFQTQAIDFTVTNLYQDTIEQTIDEELWILTTLADTAGTYNNDLFILSEGTLLLNGTYEGNIWGAGGQDVVVGGHCKRNVRLAGKNLRVDGVINGNTMIAAETVNTGTNAYLGGDVLIAGASVIQEGLIEGDVHITAGRIVTLGGIIKGNVTIVAPEILFSRGAHIAGNLSYTSGKELLPQTGVVGGNLERVIPTPEPTFAKDKLLSHFIRFLAALFAGIPFVALFPMSTAMASQLARKMPGKCLLVGVTTSIALPILGILSISAVIGLPLGMLLLAAWGTIIYVSRFITALVLGTWILRSVRSSASQVLSAMALGLAVIYLAILVPSIAVPLQLVTAWLGMGALILALLEKRRLIIQAPQKLNTLEKLRDEIFNPEEK